MALQIIFAVGGEAVGGGPIAGVLFVFGGGVNDGPGDNITGGGEILGDFVGGDGGGDILGDAVVTIIGAVGLFQEDEGFAVIRTGTVEFQAGKLGLEVEGAAGFGFHFGFDLSLASGVVMNRVAAFADHGADVFIFNVGFAVGFRFPHGAAPSKDFEAVAIAVIINDFVHVLRFTFVCHDEIPSFSETLIYNTVT
nr:MAG TPA: hypothetical protein [Caudoviricetes sp.]